MYIWIHELSSSQHVLRIPFTEIQDLVGMKRRSESKDIPIFENVAKCEHPCHFYTNEYGVAGWTKYYAIWIKKGGAVGKFNALFEKFILIAGHSSRKLNIL